MGNNSKQKASGQPTEPSWESRPPTRVAPTWGRAVWLSPAAVASWALAWKLQVWRKPGGKVQEQVRKGREVDFWLPSSLTKWDENGLKDRENPGGRRMKSVLSVHLDLPTGEIFMPLQSALAWLWYFPLSFHAFPSPRLMQSLSCHFPSGVRAKDKEI